VNLGQEEELEPIPTIEILFVLVVKIIYPIRLFILTSNRNITELLPEM